MISAVDRLVLSRPWHLADQQPIPASEHSSWIQLAKTGAFTSSRYGKFSITKADLAKMLSNFQTVTPKSPTQLVVDYDHKSMNPQKPGDGIAAGWIQDLELREDGDELWGKVAWTPPAAEHIEKKEYRFVSPSFVKNYVYKDGKQIGTTLLAAAITNHPFLEGMAAVTLCDGVNQIELNALMPGGDLVDIAVPDLEAMDMMDIGQKVTVKPGQEHDQDDAGVTFEITEVVGAGDDSFVTLKAPDGTIDKWYRATELAPANVNMPAGQPGQKPGQKPGQPGQQGQPPAGQTGQPAGQPAAQPAGQAQPPQSTGMPDPAAQAAHAAAASAHAHAAGAHAAILQKGMSMSQTFKLSTNDGAQIEVTAEQLQAAGIKLVTEDEAKATDDRIKSLSDTVVTLTDAVTKMSEKAVAVEAASRTAAMGREFDRLQAGGYITKPTRDLMETVFKDALELTQFNAWAALQTTKVVEVEVERGSATTGAAGGEEANAQLLTLCEAYIEKHPQATMRDAILKVSMAHPELSEQYREQFAEAAD